jgi:hypothetical protein
MGYCIEYAVGGGVLRAVVSGRSSFASSIAQDIGKLARDSAVRRMLIDVRKLRDRRGRLRALLAARHVPERIAVLDTWQHDNYYVFAELAAKNRGVLLRRFDDEQEALHWLQFGPDAA